MATRANLFTVFLTGILLLAGCGGESPAPPSPQETIRQKLRQVVSIDVDYEPLDVVLARVAREYGVEIHLDVDAVKTGFGEMPKVSLRVRNIQLGSALGLLLRQPWPRYDEARLTYDLADDAITVTTPEKLAETGEVGRIHPVADLLGHDNEIDEDNLAWLFDGMYPRPDSDEGVPAGFDGILPRPGVLVVSRPPLVQDEIARVLADIRQLADPAPPPPPPHRTPAEAAVYRALDKPITAHFLEKPLWEIAREWSDQHEISVVFDVRALENAGVVPEDTLVVLTIDRPLPLRTVLRWMLDQLGLAYTVWNECLLITSKDGVSDPALLYTRFYSLEGLLDAARGVGPREVADIVDYHVLPDQWTKAGGMCTYGPVPGGLMIHGHTEIHERTAALLTQLRRAMDPSVMVFDPVPGPPGARKWIEGKLAEPTRFEYKVQVLDKVIDEISKRHGVLMLFNRRAVEDSGVVPEDSLVSCRARDIPLRFGLKLVLNELGLDFIIEPSHQLLVVTSRGGADEHFTTRVHRVGGLVQEPAGTTPRRLIEAIQTIAFPDSWADAGGPGSISASGSTLVVTQTDNVHREMEQFLERLSQFSVDPPRRWDYDPSPLKPATAAIERKLDETTKFAFQETPLSDVLRFLSELHKIQIHVNRRALEDAGIVPEDTLVTRSLKDVPIRSALRLILEELGLDFVVDGSKRMVLITSKDEADGLYYDTMLVTRFYGLRGILGGATGLPSSDKLTELIENAIRADSWLDAGGPGSCLVLGDTLIVSQTQRTQHRVRQLLAGLERFFGKPSGDVVVGADAAYHKFQVALDKPTTLVAEEQPLSEVILRLARGSKTNFSINRRALEDAGIVPEDTLVSLKSRDAPLRDVLTQVCKPLKLDWFVGNHVILITSADDAEETPAPITLYRLSPAMQKAISAEALKERIYTEVLPESWDTAGGPGRIEPIPGGLLVAPVHASADKVRQLIDLQRKQFDPDASKRPPEN